MPELLETVTTIAPTGISSNSKTLTKTCSLEYLPVAINGVSLSLAGVAVELRNLGKEFSCSSVVGIPIKILFTCSISLTFLYFLKIFFYFKRTAFEDWRHPASLAAVGALCMSICLQGSIINHPFMQERLAFWYVLFGASIQLVEVTVFFRACFLTTTLPEPFFNSAVFSCFFVPVALPGKTAVAVVIRHIFFYYGLVCLLIIFPWQVWRVLFVKDAEKNLLVAMNPSCAILQAAMSISFSAWVVAPPAQTGVDAENGKGMLAIHIFFALSEFGFFVTVISLWQRRKSLLKMGINPGWASCAFPFVNTAIATGLYRKVMPSLGLWLSCWLLFQSILSIGITFGVVAVYICGKLFLVRAVE